LGFWLRKTELHRLRIEFDALARGDRLLVPRGTVFHLPPRNVDTMFVYSWLLSALTGNCNIIRLPRERSDSTEQLLAYFHDALEHASRPARDTTWVVSYGHEQEITEALSSLCDLRLIWGGDNTVSAIRSCQLPPHAHELVFADRFSLATIKSIEYRKLAEAQRDDLAKQFFNDAFWFDQMACSSPRLVVWCGTEVEASVLSADFFQRVNNYAQRQLTMHPSQSMHRFVASCAAILDRPVNQTNRLPALTVLNLTALQEFDRNHPGGGIFLQASIDELNQLVNVLSRKDQTLTAFGFTEHELREFARKLNGRAVERIVPIGRALEFGRFWDGHDLLQAFCRSVFIQT
jgi:hypothetical protein